MHTTANRMTVRVEFIGPEYDPFTMTVEVRARVAGPMKLPSHVPPWRAACWHQGQLSDAHWTPFFVCKALGDAIERVMRDRPALQSPSYAVHHSAGEARSLPNVRVLTGAAEYGAPSIAAVLEQG
jgi:lysozyme family protein